MEGDALKVIKESIILAENAPHQSRVYSAWKVIDKLCPDLKAMELSGGVNITNQEFIIGGEDDTSQA
jgi:hypothetical protein